MSEPFIGTIQAFGFNFATRGWALCQGQLLAISQNQSLFSLVGTYYGGDGRTTFGLPDLRGRVMIGQGAGPGMGDRRIGQSGGTETVTLTTAQMPSHNHPVGGVMASSSAGTSAVPSSRKNVLSASSSGDIYGNGAPDIALNTGGATGGNTGGSQPHNNMPPFLAVNISIALVGIYPSRN